MDLENFIKKILNNSKEKEFFWKNYHNDNLFKSLSQFQIFFASIARKFRSHHLSLTNKQKAFLKNQTEIDLLNFSLVDFLRLLTLKKSPKNFIEEIILRGDDYEQALALKALVLLPNSEDYKFLAVNSCRTNSSVIFSAIALDNNYPKLHFKDEEFFQMVLKSIFLELDFSKIKGIENRYKKSLARQLKDLYQEKKSAGRILPNNILTFMKQKKII